MVTTNNITSRMYSVNVEYHTYCYCKINGFKTIAVAPYTVRAVLLASNAAIVYVCHAICVPVQC